MNLKKQNYFLVSHTLWKPMNTLNTHNSIQMCPTSFQGHSVLETRPTPREKSTPGEITADSTKEC